MENIEQRVKKIIAEQLGVNEARDQDRVVVRRRPGRGLARHRRAGDGARGGIRDRDSGRGRREDHHRPAGHRLREVARQGLSGLRPPRQCSAAESSSPGWASSARWAIRSRRPGTASSPASPASPASRASMPSRLSLPDRRRGEGFRRLEVPVAEGSAPHGPLHPFRHGRGPAGLAGFGQRGHAGDGRALRRQFRLRHRRPAADRGDARRAAEERAAARFAVLHSRHHHQHDRRQPVDHARHQGPEPGHRHRLHDLHALHRRGGEDRSATARPT